MKSFMISSAKNIINVIRSCCTYREEDNCVWGFSCEVCPKDAAELENLGVRV